jgi:hypothetical protein
VVVVDMTVAGVVVVVVVVVVRDRMKLLMSTLYCL